MADEPQLEPQPWYQFIDLIDRLLDDDECIWAAESLYGMRETVIATRRVSQAQLHTIQYIRATADAGGE